MIKRTSTATVNNYLPRFHYNKSKLYIYHELGLELHEITFAKNLLSRIKI